MSGAQPSRSWLRRIGIGLASLLLLLVVSGLGACALLSKPRPNGETGPRADALAHSIETAVNKEAWARTGAVRWYFGGRNRHLWDRTRMFDRVAWGGDKLVLLNISTKNGLAFVKNGAEQVSGEAEKKLLAKAYAHWINDSFWLNPLVKLFDDGVERKLVTQPDGKSALLITYGGGGLTPGDAYLWLLDESNRPLAWRMWVSILPIKGIESSWAGWTALPTGAWVATEHRMAAFNLRLTDVAAAATLAELEPGGDPFAALVASGR